MGKKEKSKGSQTDGERHSVWPLKETENDQLQILDIRVLLERREGQDKQVLDGSAMHTANEPDN